VLNRDKTSSPGLFRRDRYAYERVTARAER
jgi:hypothetical protein